MNLTNILIPLLFVAALGFMAFFMIRKKKSGHENRQAYAGQNGLRYNRLDASYVIGRERTNLLYQIVQTKNPPCWEINAHLNLPYEEDSATSSLAAKTTWTCPIYGFTFVVLPSGLNDIVREMMLNLLSSQYESLNFVDLKTISPSIFASYKFEVLTDDLVRATRVFERMNPLLEKLSDKNKTNDQLKIIVIDGQAEIRLPWCVEEPEELDTLISLGNCLLG